MNKSLIPAGTNLPARNEDEYRSGDIIIDKNGWYIKILSVTVDENGDTMIEAIQAKTLNDDGTLEWEGGYKSRNSVKDFKYYNRPIIVAGGGIENVTHVEALAVEAMKNPQAFAGDDLKPNESVTALTTSASPDRLARMKQASREAMDRATAMQRIVERKAKALRHIASEYQKQLANITRVIGVIEMYLGVHEEILLIRDGEPAGIDEPITIRQRVLYMDEEVGDPRPRRGTGQMGIDFQSVEDFDAWVIRDENLELLLPHEKGVVALNPSRQHRMYTNNAFQNAWINGHNRFTYLLIRNGQKVYRIWTNNELGPRLIPSMTELEQKDRWPDRSKDREFSYKKKGLLLQGLIDRTPVFLPMIHAVNLFDPEATGRGLVRFVYDDEPSLAPPGRLLYAEWKEKINAEIGRGSRIVVALHHPYEQIGDKKDRSDRFVRYYNNEWSAPSSTPLGIYKVENIRERASIWSGRKREQLIIYYQPGGTVYSDWYQEAQERKNRVGFIVYRNDPFVLNYDGISLDDVEWFIGCRYEREKYLEMIPTLWEIRDRRLEELAWEREFVNLVATRQEVSEDAVWEAVEWWKTKNLWKRPIMEDDAKALRMIEAKLRREGGE